MLADAQAVGQVTGATVLFIPDVDFAITTADVVYTDVFTSMGQETENFERQLRYADFQVNQALMAKAPNHAIVLHCLPAHRDEEITHAVVEANAPWIFEQAENRHHAQKALMLSLMA